MPVELDDSDTGTSQTCKTFTSEQRRPFTSLVLKIQGANLNTGPQK